MRSLVQEDVRQGDVMAFCFDRGISQILGTLSVLKAGAAFVPLDPDDPTLRKELMVEECGAKVLLTTLDHSRVFQKSLAAKVLVSISSVLDPRRSLIVYYGLHTSMV